MPKFCPSCGKPLPFENAEICTNCGFRIKSPIASKTIKKQESGKNLILLIAAVIGIVLLIIIVVAFIFGMSGNISYNSTLSQNSEISHPTAPVVQIVQQSQEPGWNRYTIPQTQIGIYTPQDWTTTTKEMPYAGKQYAVLMSFSPDLTTVIAAFGMNVSGMVGGPASLEKELNQGYIDSETYQSVVSGLTSGNSSTPVINIIQDPNYYSISGHPARKIEYDQGNFHAEDFIIIPDKNTFVLEMMMATPQATYNDRMEGEKSMKSITG